MEQINTNKEHPLFSIKNYSDKMLSLAIIIIAVELIVKIFLTTTAEQRAVEVGSFRDNNLLAATYGVLFITIYLFIFRKNPIISFYKNKIIYQKNNKYIEITPDNILNCSVALLYSFSMYGESNNLNSMKYKVSKIKFFIRIILYIFFIVFPLAYILSFFIYREITLKLKTLIIVDNNFNIIEIPFYKRDEKKLNKYFQSNFNINILELETLYSFDNFVIKLKGENNGNK